MILEKKQRQSHGKCKRVASKAWKVANNAAERLKRAKFSRMIQQNVIKNVKRIKAPQNDIALHTGAAICAAALISVFTGGFFVEALRTGASVLVSTTVSNAIVKKKQHEVEMNMDKKIKSLKNCSPLDQAIKNAKKTSLQNAK